MLGYDMIAVSQGINFNKIIETHNVLLAIIITCLN